MLFIKIIYKYLTYFINKRIIYKYYYNFTLYYI